jgi:hypothetical protein
MGLDMYLSKKTYVKRWNHKKKEDQYKVLVRKGGKPDPSFDYKKISNIEEEVMYWRKANAIHAWFVREVQGGKDDCGDYLVTREDLEKLLDACNKVLASTILVSGKINNGYGYKKNEATGEMERYECIEDGKVLADSTVAQELLPSSSGFFFGSTEYNEWYLKDVEETKKMLEEELAKESSGDYYYHSSW